MEHPAAVEALAEEFSWAGADITQTFTYYSHTGVGTPEDCSLTVSETQSRDSNGTSELLILQMIL